MLSCVRTDRCEAKLFAIESGVRGSARPVVPRNHHTDHSVLAGSTIGNEPSTDLDCANEVALLDKMLSGLLLI